MAPSNIMAALDEVLGVALPEEHDDEAFASALTGVGGLGLDDDDETAFVPVGRARVPAAPSALAPGTSYWGAVPETPLIPGAAAPSAAASGASRGQGSNIWASVPDAPAAYAAPKPPAAMFPPVVAGAPVRQSEGLCLRLGFRSLLDLIS